MCDVECVWLFDGDGVCVCGGVKLKLWFVMGVGVVFGVVVFVLVGGDGVMGCVVFGVFMDVFVVCLEVCWNVMLMFVSVFEVELMDCVVI